MIGLSKSPVAEANGPPKSWSPVGEAAGFADGRVNRGERDERWASGRGSGSHYRVRSRPLFASYAPSLSGLRRAFEAGGSTSLRIRLRSAPWTLC